MTVPAPAPALHTPSLRRRLTVVLLVLLTVMLAVLAVTTDVVLRNRLESQLKQRLLDRAQIAVALADQFDPEDLVRRIEGNGISVVLEDADGQVYTAGPPPGASAGGPGPAGTPPGPGAKRPATPQNSTTVTQSGDVLSVSRDLTGGSTLLLTADAGDVRRTLDQTRIALLVGALAVLVLATLVIGPVVRRVLRPLDQITDLANSIRQGDRGERLRPDRPKTELGTTAQAFDEMLDAVEGAERHALDAEHRLRGFLSDAAHELRTPIAGVQAAAEHVLRADPPRADREQTLLTLVRESRRAGRLVDDMLLMARIDRGLELRTGRVDLARLAAAAIEARELTHPDATLQVTGTSPLVTADPDRLTQVIGNLLDNSLRAGGAGVHVSVVLGADTDHVHLDVVDDGPGIAAADRERVFERLVRLDESRTGADSGAGLGLPIARGIARAHGGDLVAVEPTHGRGARFRLTLPLT